MTNKRTEPTKSTTFGDESVEETPGPVAAEVVEKNEQDIADARAEETTDAETTETVEPTTWDAYEAKLRDDLAGFLQGRRIESAVKYARDAWNAAKAN